MNRPLLLIVGALSLLTAGGCAKPPSAPTVFPTTEWETVTPTEAGFDTNKLHAFHEFVGGHGVLIRYGKSVQEWGKFSDLADVASAVKPLYAHLTYHAVQTKLIPSLDSLILDFQPGLSEINIDFEKQDTTMTWRHLINQTACYGVQEFPGDAFDYSDFQTALLVDTLLDKVYKQPFQLADTNVLNPMVWSPLQCQDSPTVFGRNSHPGRLRISARDFARFGLLYLNNGNWDGKQLLPESVIHKAITSPHPASLPRTTQILNQRLPGQRSIGSGPNQEAHIESYSYMWWINKRRKNGTRVFPDAPPDTFCAIGHGHKTVLAIIPSKQIVVCWLGGIPSINARHFHDEGRKHVNTALKLLLDATSD